MTRFFSIPANLMFANFDAIQLITFFIAKDRSVPLVSSREIKRSLLLLFSLRVKSMSTVVLQSNILITESPVMYSMMFKSSLSASSSNSFLKDVLMSDSIGIFFNTFPMVVPSDSS